MSKAYGTNPRATATGTRSKATKPAPSKSAPRRKAAGPTPVENISPASEETACIPEAAVVTSLSETEPAATSATANAPTGMSPEPANNEPGAAAQPLSPAAPARSQKIMDITLNRSTATRKDERLVIFEYADGRPGQVQFLRSAFPETVPDSITMSGEFAERVEKTPKAKMTKEERAALPKPTLAEKVAKAEERAQKLRDKLANAAAADAATL